MTIYITVIVWPTQVTEKAMLSLEEPMQPGQEPKWAPKQVGGKRHPWEDVELGPLIGQGSFGKVYRGVWNGAPVAVKVGTACREIFCSTHSSLRFLQTHRCIGRPVSMYAAHDVAI